LAQIQQTGFARGAGDQAGFLALGGNDHAEKAGAADDGGSERHPALDGAIAVRASLGLANLEDERASGITRRLDFAANQDLRRGLRGILVDDVGIRRTRGALVEFRAEPYGRGCPKIIELLLFLGSRAGGTAGR